MKTVILCGGRGTRLSEETSIRPKPMVEIGGKPMLWHIMSLYAKYGFKDFVLALGYKGEDIKDYFGKFAVLHSDFTIQLATGELKYLNEPKRDWTVSLLDTGADSMTGGRLLRLKDHLKNEKYFMLTYGDGLSNINIQDLVKFHEKHGKIATVSGVRPPARFGEMSLDGDTVTKFSEKPQASVGWINGGFFVFSPKIFDYLENDATVLEKSPLETLAQENQLVAYKHSGFWQCMDTVRDKELLNSIWESGDAPWR